MKVGKKFWTSLCALCAAVCAFFGVMTLNTQTKTSASASTGLTEVTMNRVSVTNGVSTAGTTVDYVAFDGFEEGKAESTFFLVDFYGRNVPNFAVNATQALSAWKNETYATAGITLLQSFENNSNTGSAYALLGNNGFNKMTSYATLQTSTSAGVSVYEGSMTPGLNNYDASKHYIMVLGFEPGSETATAYATYSWYVFEVDDTTQTITSVGKMISSRNTPAATGQYAVIYPNILAGSETITFKYAQPKTGIEELLLSLDGVAYQEQLMSAFGIELPSGLTSATMDRVNVTSDGSESGVTVDSIPFDGFGSTFSGAYFLVDFYGQNVPNFAVNATQTYDVWDSNATYATAGLVLSLSNNGNDTYDSEELRVSNGVYGVCDCLDYYGSDSSGETYIIEQEGIKPGLLRLSKYENTHYVMLLGLEPTCDTTYPQFIWYLFEENGGVLTQVGKLIASKNTAKPTGDLAVIYPNVNEGPEQITFQYAQPATTLAGLIEGLGNGCAYKQQLIDMFVSDTETGVAETGLTEVTWNGVIMNDTAATGKTKDGTTVQSVSFDGMSGDTFFLVDFVGKNSPNFAINAKQAYSVWDGEDIGDSGLKLFTTIQNACSNLYVPKTFTTHTTGGSQSAWGKFSGTSGNGPGYNLYTANTRYVMIVGTSGTALSGSNMSQTVHCYIFKVGTDGALTNCYNNTWTGNTAAHSGSVAVIYPHIRWNQTGGSETITFSYATPKASVEELISGLGDGYAYKTQLADYFSLVKTLTVQDESGETISTENFFGSVKLPESDISNFIGWTYANGSTTELYPAGGTIEATTDITVKAVTLDLTMDDGAAARIDSNANGVGGIRFTVRTDTERLTAVSQFVNVYGVLIATDMIDGAFDNDESGASVKLLSNSVADGTDTVWYITFTNILYSNYNRTFSAKAYAEISYTDGTSAQIATTYNADENSRSVYDIAVAACNDTAEYNKLGSAQKAVLHTYVGYSVNLSYAVNGTSVSVITTEDGLADTSLRKYAVASGSLKAGEETASIGIEFTDLPASLISDSDGLPHVPVTLWTASTGEKTRVKATVESYADGVATVRLPVTLNPNWYYSENNDFILYSYHSVSSGVFTDDGVSETVDASGQTLEDTEIYSEAGFNVIKISYPFWSYDTWLKSDLKDIMDQAQSLGLKCIVSTPETTRLTQSDSSLIVTDGTADGVNTFASQAALNAYIKKDIADIVQHEAFYGLALDDEPAYTQFAAVGEVYQAIAACAADYGKSAYVLVNLLPYSPSHVANGSGLYADDEQTLGAEAAYKKYLQGYYDAVGKYSGRLQYDDYPIRENTTESYILDTHLLNAQIVAEFCKEKGLIFDKVFQTCAGGTSSKLWRAPTQTDMYWQMNIGMAMGVKGFSYWSYYPVSNVTDEYYDEKASFVDKSGAKNDLYTWMQNIHEEMQATAKALSWFDWQGMNVYQSGSVGDTDFLTTLGTTDYAYAESVTASVSGTGAALVSELYDETHKQYGYYVTNITDPTQTAELSVTVTFEGYSNVLVYRNGVATVIALSNGSATFTLATGQGVFVLPY